MMVETTPIERVQERRKQEIVRRAADRMNRMIQDLLDVRRMESGHLTMDLKAEPVDTIVNDTIDMLRPIATGSSIVMDPRVADHLPLVLADSARIQPVLSTLVCNTVKFTQREGRIIGTA